MNILCPSKIICPGTDNPFANISSEDADVDRFFASFFGGNGDGYGDNPRLGSLWITNSCVGRCVSTISAEDAFLCAARAAIFCNNTHTETPPCTDTSSGAICEWPPTLPPGEPPILPPTENPRALFGNTAQSCTRLCPDGLPFTYVVGPNTFMATTQEMADRMAFTYACSKVVAARLCLSALSITATCSDLGVDSTFSVTGGTLPFTYSVVSGSLPPGMNLIGSGRTGHVIGTPLIPGNFTFTIRVSTASGTFMQKTYTLRCLGITSSSPIPDAEQDTAYSHQLAAAGGTPPYAFALEFGSLPAGLSMSAAGLISGTPTESGTFAFEASVTDSA